MRLEKFIPRTPLDVWSIVTDWVVAEYWLGVEKLRPLHSREKPRAGSRLTYRVRGREHPMTITRFEPQKRLALESFQGGIKVTYAYSFHRVDGRWAFDTRVMHVDQVGDISQHLRRPPR